MSSRLVTDEIWNRLHRVEVDDARASAARALIGGLELLELSPPVLDRALEAFPLCYAPWTLGGSPIRIASCDERMREAATAMGFDLYTL